jgi:hypothetical protein
VLPFLSQRVRPLQAINALLKEKEELVRRVKELEEAAQHVAGPGREELAVAEKRVLELEASLEVFLPRRPRVRRQ